MVGARAVLLAGCVLLLAAPLRAEPIFLSRQYTRCTTCHYSPTGGGLLTPYGRSLSRQELSTTGRSDSTAPPDKHGEEAFLWGLLGNTLGPVDVGIDVRPAHLGYDIAGTTSDRDFFMNADLLAAYRIKGFTIYGEVGRQPLAEGSKIDSYEYWVSYQTEKGLGLRAGRFLPSYGVRLADHSAFTRLELGLDIHDQLYGLEVSRTWDHYLLQATLSPGRAESILHDDGRRAFTAAGRFQMDLGPRTVLVASGLFRDASRVDPQNGSGGLALGLAPWKRLSIWTEADAQFQQGSPGAPAYTLLNETGFEVFRGIWLKVSPQIRTDYGHTSGGVIRMAFEANLLPRTHWNVDVSYYHDKTRLSGFTYETLLFQLHLYL